MADGYGPKGYPKFGPESNAELWPKLQEVGEFAAKVGNRRVGTKAQREALSTSATAAEQAGVGLEFYETDTGRTYRCTSVAPLSWVEVTEPKSNTAFGLVGEVPAAVPQLQFRAFHAVVTLGASGTGEVAYPGGAFPNAVLFANVGVGDADGSRGFNANLRSRSVQALHAVRFIVTNAAGTSAAQGLSMPVAVFAIGY